MATMCPLFGSVMACLVQTTRSTIVVGRNHSRSIRDTATTNMLALSNVDCLVAGQACGDNDYEFQNTNATFLSGKVAYLFVRTKKKLSRTLT